MTTSLPAENISSGRRRGCLICLPCLLSFIFMHACLGWEGEGAATSPPCLPLHSVLHISCPSLLPLKENKEGREELHRRRKRHCKAGGGRLHSAGLMPAEEEAGRGLLASASFAALCPPLSLPLAFPLACPPSCLFLPPHHHSGRRRRRAGEEGRRRRREGGEGRHASLPLFGRLLASCYLYISAHLALFCIIRQGGHSSSYTAHLLHICPLPSACLHTPTIFLCFVLPHTSHQHNISGRAGAACHPLSCTHLPVPATALLTPLYTLLPHIFLFASCLTSPATSSLPFMPATSFHGFTLCFCLTSSLHTHATLFFLFLPGLPAGPGACLGITSYLLMPACLPAYLATLSFCSPPFLYYLFFLSLYAPLTSFPLTASSCLHTGGRKKEKEGVPSRCLLFGKRASLPLTLLFHLFTRPLHCCPFCRQWRQGQAALFLSRAPLSREDGPHITARLFLLPFLRQGQVGCWCCCG